MKTGLRASRECEMRNEWLTLSCEDSAAGGSSHCLCAPYAQDLRMNRFFC